MVLNPDLMEEKVLGLWMPKFSVTTKLALKSSLAKRPEMAEFFSDFADYSRMANQRVKVNEVHHMVIILVEHVKNIPKRSHINDVTALRMGSSQWAHRQNLVTKYNLFFCLLKIREKAQLQKYKPNKSESN